MWSSQAPPGIAGDCRGPLASGRVGTSAWFDDYLYARISEDEVGQEKGVTRQLADLRDLSVRRNGRVVGEWSDNDISAKNAAPRPDYDALIAAVAAPNPTGRQRRILTVHTSRLWRNRVERGAGIDALGKLGLIIVQLNGPELDLRSAQGRWMADMLGTTDTAESETKSERICDAARERAHEGRANGPVLYGWSRIYEYDSRGKVVGFRDEENHQEADVVREIVKRLLTGESIRAITDDLNRRKIPAPGAGQKRKHRAKGQTDDGTLWCKTSVKKVATRPANIGMRVYHRGRPDEALLPAAWPMIVDLDKHDRVVALLSAPERRTNGVARPGARHHLLTWGVGECGKCGGHLRVAPRGNRRYGLKMSYLCAADECLGRNQEAVDLMAHRYMVELLRRDDVADLLAGSQSKLKVALERVRVLRRKLDRAAEDYAEDRIDNDQLRIINDRVKPQLREAEAAASAYRPSPHVELVMSIAGPSAEQRWGQLDVNQRRAVMTALGVVVTILPARKGPGFDPASVRISRPQPDVS